MNLARCHFSKTKSQASVLRSIDPLVTRFVLQVMLHVKLVNSKDFIFFHFDFNQFRVYVTSCFKKIEPPREKTNNLHMRKQRRRSASR